MLCTEDDQIASRVKKMRLHGIDRTIWDRFTSTQAKWEYDVVAPGYKYNLPDLSAAVGIAQLERAHEFHERRQKIVKSYRELLRGCSGLRLPPIEKKEGDHAWHLFVIQLDNRINRNEFIKNLSKCGVSTSVHYKPLHQMTYWKNRTNITQKECPGAEAWWNSCVSLPLFPAMTNQEIEHVCTTVRRILSDTCVGTH